MNLDIFTSNSDSNSIPRCMTCKTEEKPLYKIKKERNDLIFCYSCGKATFGELWDFNAEIIEIRD